MHIGIDLGIQRLNSNVFGKLLDEEKDYFINTVTQEFVKLGLTDEKNTVFDINTYQDIREYYERLQVYVRSLQLGLVDELGSGYVYGALPESITVGEVISGVLYQGVKYKVIAAGSPALDLSLFGYTAAPIVGETFECDITTQTGGVTVAILIGEKYRIVNSAGIDFATFGALNNNPGTEFVAILTNPTFTSNVSTVLQNLSDTPDWATAGTAKLIPTNDIGYYMNISTRSSITKGNVITSGDLVIGKKYMVNVVGSTITLGNVGGVITPDIGYVFVCTATGTITWLGGTELYEIDDNGNRLVKVQDVEDFLTNSFGTTKSSPISIFAGNRLRVYHDNKFDIERVFIDYIRKPITVSLSAGIDSDLPESTQPFLVDLVVKKIAALSGNPTYPAIANEIKDKD